jgi:hypothetical protein
MIRLILNNKTDIASLDADPALDEDYGVTHLATRPRKSTARSISTLADQTLMGTWTSTVPISSLVIGRHNFSRYMKYRFILYSDAAYNDIIYDSGQLTLTDDQIASDYLAWGEFPWGIVPWSLNNKDKSYEPYKNIVMWLDQVYNALSFKLILYPDLTLGPGIYCNEQDVYANNSLIFCNVGEFTVASDTGIPYFEVGRLIMGEYEEPTYNISYNHTMTWDENTSQYRAGSGTLRSDNPTVNKKFEFNINTIPEADRITLYKEFSEIGLTKDFYISMFPNDNSYDKELDYSGIVKLTKIPKYTNFITGYYKSSFVMEEA